MLKKWQEHSFVSDNAHEDISKTQSAELYESESIQKSKRLETTYDNCARLLHTTSYYYTHTNVDLLGMCDVYTYGTKIPT